MRIAAAALRSPRARSSITRSIMDSTKVTPAALIACRSIGASSQGLCRSRASRGVLASTSSTRPMRSPPTARSDPPAIRLAQVAHGGEARRDVQQSPLRTATTEGPATSGRQTRPASAAEALSSGSTGSSVSPIAAIRRSSHSRDGTLTMPNQDRGGPPDEAVRLVARDGHRDLSVTHTDEEWRAKLSPGQYQVLRKHGTERAGTSPLNAEKRHGIFTCAGCGQDLFDSETKFESGTGWPSFYQPLEGAVGVSDDRSFFMTRTEVHCSRCGGHLGHVFPDGPRPTDSATA